jgi:hypothetical protein
MVVSPATPKYLNWYEVPITFDRSNHPEFIPKSGMYLLIVSPIIKDIKLNRILISNPSQILDSVKFPTWVDLFLQGDDSVG